MIRKIIIFLFFITVAVFAQGEIADTNYVEIADTVELAELVEIADSLEISEMNIEILAEEAEDNKRVFWYISLTPRVGVDNIQREFTNFLSERSDTFFTRIRREAGREAYRYRQVWYQPASASGVSFALGTGIYAEINSKSALEIGAAYSFSQMRAVYGIENAVDSTEALRMRTLLVNNTIWLSANYKMRFDSSYFSIQGVDFAGFYAGGAFMLSRYFERDTVNSEIEIFNEQRRKNYDGIGWSGRAGIFAQRKIGRNAFFEYSLGYLFSVKIGFDDFWDREFYWENNKKRDRNITISNALELSFTFFF